MRDRVAIVTGGGGGIGAEVSVELARRGAIVVVLDSGDGLRGEPLGERSAERTVRRIEAAGGRAVAAPISVTDADAVRGLVAETVARFGSLDVVVNAAGIVRFPRIGDAAAEVAADDWAALLGVHLGGYLTLLAAALPRMTAAGYGRIVGVTSGVGLARTSVDGPAYGSAKRAVAALTWQLGPVLPAGVAVNALSPIAATRMVTEGLVAAGADPRGLDLSAMPQPEHMAPAAARLASEEFGWCRGRVLFSAGSELSLIAPPRLVEAVATGGAGAAAALGALARPVLAPAHAQQRSTGGSNPRSAPLAAVPPGSAGPSGSAEPGVRACLVVGDDRALADQLAAALAPWGYTTAAAPVGVTGTDDAATGFAAAEQGLGRAAATTAAGLGAVVVIHGADATSPGGESGGDWRAILASHAGTAATILGHAAWSRAAARHVAATGRALRVVHVVPALSPGGRSAAQAVTQLARSVNDTPIIPTASNPGLLEFAVSAESPHPADRVGLVELVASLVAAPDTAALAGAELVVRPGWLGLRAHPAPAVTASLAGAELGPWTDDVLRDALAPFG
ncbi:MULTISPECIES: SDR family NAD(P)-dependent oxidoreductase [Frankia]|uniref:SDR family NAD(P)-dependent oxidoreductase n=1 Tax=Frankia TaxID=1854 RepID=UPI0012FD8256|nr:MULTISPECIES: SDR family NAD(P)-dependent oxidoreductase [Frankia]